MSWEKTLQSVLTTFRDLVIKFFPPKNPRILLQFSFDSLSSSSNCGPIHVFFTNNTRQIKLCLWGIFYRSPASIPALEDPQFLGSHLWCCYIMYFYLELKIAKCYFQSVQIGPLIRLQLLKETIEWSFILMSDKLRSKN